MQCLPSEYYYRFFLSIKDQTAARVFKDGKKGQEELASVIRRQHHSSTCYKTTMYERHLILKDDYLTISFVSFSCACLDNLYKKFTIVICLIC